MFSTNSDKKNNQSSQNTKDSTTTTLVKVESTESTETSMTKCKDEHDVHKDCLTICDIVKIGNLFKYIQDGDQTDNGFNKSGSIFIGSGGTFGNSTIQQDMNSIAAMIREARCGPETLHTIPHLKGEEPTEGNFAVVTEHFNYLELDQFRVIESGLPTIGDWLFQIVPDCVDIHQSTFSRLTGYADPKASNAVLLQVIHVPYASVAQILPSIDLDTFFATCKGEGNGKHHFQIKKQNTTTTTTCKQDTPSSSSTDSTSTSSSSSSTESCDTPCPVPDTEEIVPYFRGVVQGILNGGNYPRYLRIPESVVQSIVVPYTDLPIDGRGNGITIIYKNKN